MDRFLRIHGDNIVECDRTLQMLSDAFGVKPKILVSPINMPIYELSNNFDRFEVTLLSGHDRCGIDINDELIQKGGLLREGADSYITEVVNQNEVLLLAIEYCSALPAGNNAWQRNGRALSTVYAGVPYLYFAELGGVELDSNTRLVKTPRYPNPIVPFSYLSLSVDAGIPCLPIYRPHPSITSEIYNEYKEVFGYQEAVSMIKNIIAKEDYSRNISTLMVKTLSLVNMLSEKRKMKNTLCGAEWTKLLKSSNRSLWLSKNTDLHWSKFIADKVQVPDRIRNLLSETQKIGAITIGASELPICVIPKSKLKDFRTRFRQIYPKFNLNISQDKPLALVWITGYKPHGDDSRPDRGLCPLAKMVLGNSAKIMAIVYGPAKSSTFDKIKNKEAISNGLWQAIYNIADYAFADSVHYKKPLFIKHKKSSSVNKSLVEFKAFTPTVKEFTEQDTDTAIHQILSHTYLMECLCNPPGGDWSGIDFYLPNKIYRWTSLPRVSEVGGKRPDHVFQWIQNDKIKFITIESKGHGRELEDNIGTNLRAYLVDLFKQEPTSIKCNDDDWRLFDDKSNLPEYEVISVGAFMYRSEDELKAHLQRGNLDAIIAFEFKEISLVHLLANQQGFFLVELVKQAQRTLGGFEIEIH